jgi:hypothetical protein
MGALAAELHTNLPAHFKDLDRAEMMLGYLAKRAASVNERYPTPTSSDFQASGNDAGLPATEKKAEGANA